MAAPFEVTGFLRTRESRPQPDVQVDLTPIGMDPVSTRTNRLAQMLPFPAVTVSIKNSYPVSRGFIQLLGNDPAVAPLIEPRLLASNEDVETLAVTSPQEVAVLVVVTVRSEPLEATANLAAPILVNTARRLGRQKVLSDSRYSVRHPLFATA